MNNKLKSFLEPADFKLEGILTSDNKRIDSYFINYINGSIYQFYNNSNDTITNYEHILILFLTEEDDFLKEVREIRKIKMIENGRNFDGEDITKTTELDNMKLAYYCDIHNVGRVRETMLVFSSYNMKASNIKKEVNDLLNRKQQENSLETYRDCMLRLSENIKSIDKAYKSIQERMEKYIEKSIIEILNKKKITKDEFTTLCNNEEIKAVNISGTLEQVSVSGKRNRAILGYKITYKNCDYYIDVEQ